MTVVVSPPTTREILNEGVRETVSEACVPIKVFHGHVRHLASRVDYLFIPRYVSADRATVFCPKFLGLPDMVKSMKGLGPVLSPRIDTRRRAALFSACLELAQNLGFGYAPSVRAWFKATRAWEAGVHQEAWKAALPTGGPSRGPSSLRIAVLGYPYEIYDRFVSVDVIARLVSMGVSVLTPEMFDQRELTEEGRHFEKGIFWHFSDRVLKAGYKCCHTRSVDGIIHVTAFGCGPDAISNQLLEIEATSNGMPFLSLLVDEYSGEAGVVTRLEAFVDMVRRRLRKGA